MSILLAASLHELRLGPFPAMISSGLDESGSSAHGLGAALEQLALVPESLPPLGSFASARRLIQDIGDPGVSLTLGPGFVLNLASSSRRVAAIPPEAFSARFVYPGTALLRERTETTACSNGGLPLTGSDSEAPPTKGCGLIQNGGFFYFDFQGGFVGAVEIVKSSETSKGRHLGEAASAVHCSRA